MMQKRFFSPVAFLFALGAVIVSANYSAQAAEKHERWVNIFPPRVGIYGLWRDVRNPTTLYATTRRGLYTTTNGGMYWSPLFMRQGEWLTFAQSPSDPSIMYLGATGPHRGGGVYKRSDGGRTWSNSSAGAITKGVCSLHVSPDNPLIAYVITDRERVTEKCAQTQLFKTLNGGKSWAEITPEGVGGSLLLAIDRQQPDHLILGSRNGGWETFPAVSHDGGVSWEIWETWADLSPLYGTTTKNGYWAYVGVHPTNNKSLLGLAGTSHGTVPVTSRDAGKTWREARLVNANWSKQPRIQCLEWDDQSDQVIYAGATDNDSLASGDRGAGLYVTKDGGRSWCRLLSESTSAFVQSDPGTLYVLTIRGVLKSSDGGRSWHLASLGLPDTYSGWASPKMDGDPFENFEAGKATTIALLGLVDEPSGKIFVGGQGGFWTTDNHGLSWQWHDVADTSGQSAIQTGFGTNRAGGNVRQIIKGGDGSLYLNMATKGAFGSGGSEIIKIDASGKATKIRTDKSPRALAMSPANPRIMYLVAEEPTMSHTPVLLKSDDGGFSWSVIELNRWQRASLKSRRIGRLSIGAVSPQTADALYVVTGWGDEEALLASRDGGATWQDVYPFLEAVIRKGQPSGKLLGITSVVVDPKDFNTVYVASGNRLFRSKNGGKTWVEVKGGDWIANIVGIAVSPLSSNVLYLATHVEIWRSADGGAKWSLVGEGFHGDRIRSVIPSSSVVLAQGYSGIYRLSDNRLEWAKEDWERLEKLGPIAGGGTCAADPTN